MRLQRNLGLKVNNKLTLFKRLEEVRNALLFLKLFKSAIGIVEAGLAQKKLAVGILAGHIGALKHLLDGLFIAGGQINAEARFQIRRICLVDQHECIEVAANLSKTIKNLLLVV